MYTNYPSNSTGFLLLFIFACNIIELSAGTSQLRFRFYDQEIQLDFQAELLYNQPIRVEELALRRVYRELSEKQDNDLLENLQSTAQRLQLNDWLYSELVEQSLSKIYNKSSTATIVQMAKYLLLAQSGYDVRLTYRDAAVQVNVYTEDVLYEVPLIKENNRQYANISVKGRNSTFGRSMYLLDHRPNPDGRAFSFIFASWPEILSNTATRSLSFPFRGNSIELSVSYNSGIAELLKNYPLVAESWYLNAPLSASLNATLIPQLKKLTQALNTKEQLELLAAFTRSAFHYKDDKESFGVNKPMVADELFFYPYSDCEDRSALFYALVKELLDIPMIVVAFDDHLSIAVASPGLLGDAINYKGRKYIFCDPTGPPNSYEIGVIPPGYENQSFEIIGEHPGY